MSNLLTQRRIQTIRDLRPDDVPGLQVWLDPSDVSTLTYSGSNVTQCADKSGFGRHVTSATAGLPPTTTTNTPNGLTALDFTSQQLDQPSTLTYTVGTLIAAWEHPSTNSGDYNGICGYRTSGIASSMEMELILPQLNPTIRIWALTSLSFARFIANGQERPTSENDVFNGSPAKTTPNRWNVAALSQTPSSGSKRLCIGSDPYAPTVRRAQNCRIGDVLVYDRILPEWQILGLTQYLTRKWGAAQ